MERIEQLLKEKTFVQLSNEERILCADLFEDEESYTACRKFILEIDEPVSIEFPEEIDEVIYTKLQEQKSKPILIPAMLRYAALALLFLGLGFISAWFFKPNDPVEILSNTIIQHDTIQVIETKNIIDTFFIAQKTIEVKTIEVLVYVENNDAFNVSDSLMLFADSVSWENEAVVLNNSLEKREDLNVFYSEN